ncbi:MAG: DUF262 domain-containing protein [Crocinitomix sp.]|nr:DUF262 domain-containing protein [Crocinitomix sp.]
MQEFTKTFWDIITDYSIEIPNIQRDYTYGRKSAETIRKKLISAIHLASTAEKPLHLDFVYGKLKGVDNYKLLDKNKQSINTLLGALKSYASNLHIDLDYTTKGISSTSADFITFIPLDGQQRLTTLFLIHWFLAKKTANKEALEKLKRFTYATRNSSRDFLKMLIEIDTELLEVDNSILSEIIETNEAFFTFWKKDPTVQSVLVVLDEINTHFNSADYQTAWTNLTEKNTVTFDFFNLDDFEQTDELYVKMNARGKHLTHFENFKAWLIKSHSASINVSDWRKKLDISWNDLFWNAKENGSTEIDLAYLKYFKRMFLGDYIKSNELTAINLGSIEILRLEKEINPLVIFEDSPVFAKNIDDYLQLLAYCSSNAYNFDFNQNFYEGKFDRLVFNDPENSTWWHETLYFAMTRYLIKVGGDATNLNAWKRVVSNLIYNTTIDTPKLYKGACNSILELLDIVHNKSIYEVLSSDDFTDKIDLIKTGLSRRQVTEEIKKAKRIIADPKNEWESLFVRLEKEKYFYGQIDFIFDLCADESIAEFERIGKKVSALFSEEVMKDNTCLLFRAFLTQKQDFFKNGSTFTYPSNDRGTVRNRNENWRKLINNDFLVIKSLINYQLFDEKNILNSLKNIIQNTPVNDKYLACIINSDKVLRYPDKNHIKKYDNAYYLLKTSRIFGYYVELFTYNWFMENSKLFKDGNVSYKYSITEAGLNKVGISIDEDTFIFFAKKRGCFKINTFENKEFDEIEEAYAFVLRK